MRKFLGFVGVASLLAGPAIAADLGTRAPVYKAPPPSPVFSWAGWYIGLNAGAEWGSGNGSAVGTPGPCSAVLAGCVSVPNYSTLMANAVGGTGFGGNNNGFIGGGQIGYNWQSGTLVTGIEADIQGLSANNGGSSGVVVIPSPAFPAFPLTETFANEHRVDWLGTVRGRLVWLATPTFLIYGTGGLAYGGVKASTAITQSIAPPDPSIPASGIGGVSETRAGWTVGGGLEWMFAPNWSLKGEYMYFDLGSASYDIPLAVVSTAVPGAVTGSATAHISQDFKGSIARVGVNYHF